MILVDVNVLVHAFHEGAPGHARYRDWLDGVVALYIADFKFGNDECAKRLAGVGRYLEVVTRNLRIAAERTPMIIRHLLMPGHVDCCFRPVVDWTAEHLPGVRFQLHTGYVPCWRASGDAKMGRLTSADEVREAWGYLRTKDLQTGARLESRTRSAYGDTCRCPGLNGKKNWR